MNTNVEVEEGNIIIFYSKVMNFVVSNYLNTSCITWEFKFISMIIRFDFT